MSTRALRNIPAWSSLSAPSKTSKRLFHHSLARASASAVAPPATHASGSNGGIWDYRLSDLVETLQRANAAPNRIWASYQALLSDSAPGTIPPEIHQHVLRRCTHSFAVTRKPSAQRAMEMDVPATPHIHENRFRVVINNIRSSGGRVELDDFHFILRQFAAAGHHLGARQVLAEVSNHGLTPTAKTYGFVFQALAHRLTLPIRPGQEEELRKQASRVCVRLLTSMSAAGIPMSPGCMDLAVRILGETADHEAFDLLLKTAYGIDLSPTPSRMGLSGLSHRSDSSATALSPHAAAPLPFSLAALNTIVETLGRTQRISKLVQAFEVLTNPLPPPRTATEEEMLEMDDEEDDGDFDLPWTPPEPHTAPNSTTYNLLVKWTSRAGNSTLARHFLTEAMEVDRLADRRLRSDVHNNVPLEDIVGPRVAVSKRTVMPLVGLANRQHDIWLLRWLVRICNRAVRRKTVHVGYYQDWVKRLHEQGLHEPLPVILDDVHGAREYLAQRHQASSSSSPQVPALEVDLDEVAPRSIVEPKKPFKPAVHIAILQRDLFDLQELSKEIAENMLGRAIQRRKERLGRRVWAGKDIYLRDQDRRVQVAKEDWAQIVGWKPKGVAGKEVWREVWSEELMHAPRRGRPKVNDVRPRSRHAGASD